MSKKRAPKRQRTISTQEPSGECPFSCEWEGSDAVLIVEDRTLHIHTLVLSLYSPVFKAMFTSGFAEFNTKKVSLHGKDYKTVENLLMMIYPQFSLNLWETSPEDIGDIMSLVQEYMMDSIRKTIQEHCDNFMERKLKEHYKNRFMSKPGKLVKFLTIADRYDFHDVICKAAIYLSAQYTYFCEKLEDHSSIIKATGEREFSDKTMVKIIGNMIKKHAEKMRRSSGHCENCKESYFALQGSKSLTDIDAMADFLISENCFKKD